VRTAAVVKLEQYIPDIQDDLRRSGFPKFTKGKVHELRFDLADEPKATIYDRFDFQDRDGSNGIVLTSNSVSLHTNRYAVFEEFVTKFAKAVATVNEILDFDFAERIGLRYVDLVRAESGERFEQYLSERILGPDPASFGMEKALTRFEMVGSTSIGTFALRLWQLGTGQFLPPDLWPTNLKYTTVLNQGETASLLDLDHHSDQQIDFDVQRISETAWKLHNNLDLGFHAVVTPFALEKWGLDRNETYAH
jgi:uncharacterized protein (TIGR04255 family)